MSDEPDFLSSRTCSSSKRRSLPGTALDDMAADLFGVHVD